MLATAATAWMALLAVSSAGVLTIFVFSFRGIIGNSVFSNW